MTFAKPHFLMCAPNYFGVNYVINPWMEGQIGHADRNLAETQWKNYVEKLKAAGAQISLMDPKPGLPDFVFTANAGIIRNKHFIPARFRFAERQNEEALNIAWFAANGFEVLSWPQDVFCEGAGTALFMLDDNDRQTDTIVVAKDFRSDAIAADYIYDLLNVKVVRVELEDPRFYHLDTCFCALPGNRAIWYPPAFTRESREIMQELFAPEKLFAVNDKPAEGFACNAVHVNGQVFMNTFDAPLEAWLQSHGFTAVEVPLWEFLKAGGAAKCLTLRIDH